MDPARFWEITPRLLDLEFKAAKARIRRERELVWWGAMLPNLKQPVALDKFIGGPADEISRVRQFHDAWDRIDRSLRH